METAVSTQNEEEEDEEQDLAAIKGQVRILQNLYWKRLDPGTWSSGLEANRKRSSDFLPA